MNALTPISLPSLAAIVADADAQTQFHFLEFFTATIRNPHTRRAYSSDIDRFLSWCAGHGITALSQIHSLHVSTYIELATRTHSAPSVKRNLSAIRHLFDWLVVKHIVPSNPSTSVRGPKHSQRKGKTPVLAPDEARDLLNAIDATTPIGLRDRALIATMLFSFGRVGAVTGMKVEDVVIQQRRHWIRLHEKGGKEHSMPCHHTLEGYVIEWLEASGLKEEPKAPLFPTIRRGSGRGAGELTRTPMNQSDAYERVRRHGLSAAIGTKVGNHSMRGTGITTYLKNGGTLEKAARMANHSSTRTTQLYDRRSDDVSLDEVKRILI